MRLTPDALDRLPAGIRKPGYDRRALRPGILHLGLGAFSRCHLAEHTEDALEARFGAWGIRAVNLRAPDLAPLLGPSGGLYLRELREGEARDRRVIGAVLDGMTPGDAGSLARALAIAADPAIRVVTLTVTEKGYCHIPATGRLDERHPDILHDLAHPTAPRSVPGFVLQAIRARRAAGTAQPGFLSCDNVPGNGATLRSCVLALARARDAALAGWVEENVAFPDTMVDRIVPATRPEDIAALEAETGLLDPALVIGEPFRAWVIGQDARVETPDWAAAGAIFAADVAPYEVLKMRVVNGAQTGLCHLGHMAGHVFMSDVMADPVFAGFAGRMLREETAPNLPRPAGFDQAGYIAQTLQRLRNPALRHATAQISTDGSRKIRQRLLEPMADNLRQGRPSPLLELAVAGWMAHLASAPEGVSDPALPAIAAIAAETGGVDDYVARLLALREVFAPELATLPGLAGRLAALVSRLRAEDARAVVAAHVNQG